MASQELIAEYKALAKRADQALVRLEKLSEQEHYHGVKNYAYARAARDIRAWDQKEAKAREKKGLKPAKIEPGNIRFNRGMPKNEEQLRAKIADIRTFLDAPTSSKTKIKDIYQRRADTVNKRYKTNFTWEELANYYESTEAEKIAAEHKASKSLIKALGAVKNLDTPEQIHKAQRKNARIVKGDDIANQIARELLANNVDIAKMFK